VIEGGPGLVRGITYVPEEQLALAMRVAETDALVAACTIMDLDFAFVTGGGEMASDRARVLAEEGVAPFWSVVGPLGVVAEQQGWRSVLKDTIEDPRGLGSALDEAANAVCASVDEAGDAGAFAFVVADDLAGAGGMMISPDWVIDELAPRLSQIATYAGDRGMVPVFHSDGDVRTVLRALARAGFAAIHGGGLGWSAFEQMSEAARSLGLAVIGGLEGEDLRAGDVAAIAAGARVAVASESGGMLVADDGGLTTAKEVSALVAALGAARGRASGIEN
jgi:hypothetical protein